jgi:hypothetical protein
MPSPPPNQKPLEQRLEEAARRAEEDLRRFVRYLDAEVVPEVRRHSSTALRSAAEHLQKLADSMDDAKAGTRPEDGSKGTTSGPNP